MASGRASIPIKSSLNVQNVVADRAWSLHGTINQQTRTNRVELYAKLAGMVYMYMCGVGMERVIT